MQVYRAALSSIHFHLGTNESTTKLLDTIAQGRSAFSLASVDAVKSITNRNAVLTEDLTGRNAVLSGQALDHVQELYRIGAEDETLLTFRLRSTRKDAESVEHLDSSIVRVRCEQRRCS